MNKTIVTRFAPSPTGFLHIGGARTALFNWLYAKKMGGKFLLRIEDTDRLRSTEMATSAILNGLEWLKLSWDATAIYQKDNAERHRVVAEKLLTDGNAYKCYSTKEEILNFQNEAKNRGTSTIFKSPWRDTEKKSNNNEKFVIRLRAPFSGITEVIDEVKGLISWKNNALDDLILLRQDETPTYMLAVVVDDYDMRVSHVIRGDDHLTNTARQLLIYKSMKWAEPTFAHLPLIYGSDGTKMSKRHGAVGVSEYKEMGYPSEAFNNYLTRLGWSHGDTEFFTMELAIKWFSLNAIGKSPARFDIKKLNSISKLHLKSMEPQTLINNVTDFATARREEPFTTEQNKFFSKTIDLLKDRSNNYIDIIENAQFFLKTRPIKITQDAQEFLNEHSSILLQRLTLKLRSVSWKLKEIETMLSVFLTDENIKLQELAQPLRAALIGQKSSPSIAAVMTILGREETLARLTDVSI